MGKRHPPHSPLQPDMAGGGLRSLAGCALSMLDKYAPYMQSAKPRIELNVLGSVGQGIEECAGSRP